MAYQTSNFAYQGAGQFAYQEGVVVVKPKFGRPTVPFLTRAQVEKLEAKWLQRERLEHPQLRVPPAEVVTPPLAEPSEWEVYGHNNDLWADSASDVAADLIQTPASYVEYADEAVTVMEASFQDTHTMRAASAGSSSVESTATPESTMRLRAQSQVDKDLWLERPIGPDELLDALSKLPK